MYLRAEYNGGLKFMGINVDIKVMFFETAGVLKSLSLSQIPPVFIKSTLLVSVDKLLSDIVNLIESMPYILC